MHRLIICCLCVIVAWSFACTSGNGNDDEIAELNKKIEELQSQLDSQSQINTQSQQEIQAAEEYLAFVDEATPILRELGDIFQQANDTLNWDNPTKAWQFVNDLDEGNRTIFGQIEALYAPEEAMDIKNSLRTIYDKTREYLSDQIWFLRSKDENGVLSGISVDMAIDISQTQPHELVNLHTSTIRELADLRHKYEHIANQ
ncbi:hypothetical protein ACFLU3_00105 [Chloroflexota bacterium]